MNNVIMRIVNIIGILASVSFFFYFAGLLYDSAYYVTLNIPFTTDLNQYNYYVVNGIMLYFPFIIFLPFIITKIADLYELKSVSRQFEDNRKKIQDNKKLLNNALKEIEEDEKDKDLQEAKRLLEEAEQIEKDISAHLDNINDTQGKILEHWDSKQERLALVLLALFYLNLGFWVYLWQHVIIISSIYSVLVLILGYPIYRWLKIIIHKSYLRLILSSISVILILAFLIPVSEGITFAMAELKNDTFKKVVITEDNDTYKADYFFADSNNYVLRVNNEIVSIPISKVSKIQWASRPSKYWIQ